MSNGGTNQSSFQVNPPTAVANTTGNIYIPANAVLLSFAVTPGVTKIANIEAASSGFLSIIESL
jgi:hypothetical protein